MEKLQLDFHVKNFFDFMMSYIEKFLRFVKTFFCLLLFRYTFKNHKILNKISTYTKNIEDSQILSRKNKNAERELKKRI